MQNRYHDLRTRHTPSTVLSCRKLRMWQRSESGSRSTGSCSGGTGICRELGKKTGLRLTTEWRLAVDANV